MAYLIKETAKLNAVQLLEKTNFIVERMTDNPDFPEPVPALDTVTDAMSALQSAVVAALDGGKTAMATRRVREKELRVLVNQLGDHVSSVARGNELLIRKGGFGVRRTPLPAPEPQSPRDLRALISDHKGRVDLRWLPAVPALTYHIEHSSTDPEVEANWKLVGVSTRSRYSVKGLPSGALSYFRVAGIGTAGVGPWSQVASTLVR
jgi:hypothetical protein